MKKDYVYQDKGQFKLLQNATRIGGFMAGDQGIVPAEQVLPEQRFAHQPIFRRPPEELIEYSFSNGAGLPGNHDVWPVRISKGEDGGYKVLKMFRKTKKADGYVKLRNWGDAEIAAVPNGESLHINNSDYRPVFFKNHLWFITSTWGLPGDPGRDVVFYSGIKNGADKTRFVKFAISEPGYNLDEIYFIYQDEDSLGNILYKIIVGRNMSFSNPGIQFIIEYFATTIDGPWTFLREWNITAAWGAPDPFIALESIVQELAGIIRAKKHNELSIPLTSTHSTYVQNCILREVYYPPWYDVYGQIPPFSPRLEIEPISRGKEGEIIIIDLYSPQPYLTYLAKRQGNGNITKTLYEYVWYGS